MGNIKLITAISLILVVFGIIFSLLPHETHELLTFGANISHFLHFVMGFIIVGIGLLIIGVSIKNGAFKIDFSTLQSMKNDFISNRKRILAVTASILIGIMLLKIFLPPQANAETDFEELKKIAKEYHENPQQTAQEKFGIVGKYQSEDFNPTEYLTTWNFNNLPPEERAKYYKESKLSDGRTLREYWIYAEDKEIEIAPGVFFPAWTYNGQVPAPTIRAVEGDLIRIHFTNKGTKPHTMHFHGFHSAEMDGAMTEDFVYPGKSFTYEFTADPFGVHLFHCHSVPIKQHISKGLYGAYIVDPKNDTKPKPDMELVMVMNAFDTNLDGENEVYAVNTKAFYYAINPIKVKKGELIRIYLINIIEFDPINSFHLHATFFDEYRTGTKLEPNAYTDIISMAQAERSIIDVRFRYPGMYMFHAHVSEFTELGWMGFFEVEE